MRFRNRLERLERKRLANQPERVRTIISFGSGIPPDEFARLIPTFERMMAGATTLVLGPAEIAEIAKRRGFTVDDPFSDFSGFAGN